MYDIIVNEDRKHILHGRSHLMHPNLLGIGQDSIMILPIKNQDYKKALDFYISEYPDYQVFEIIKK
jgi:hypothetical protein